MSQRRAVATAEPPVGPADTADGTTAAVSRPEPSVMIDLFKCALARTFTYALVAVLVRLLGVKMVVGATEADRRLGMPVTAYVLVISLMVAFAFGTGRWWAIVGALLFYGSDACIGWSRFVSEFRFQRPAIMITYHLGQTALVLSMLGAA